MVAGRLYRRARNRRSGAESIDRQRLEGVTAEVVKVRAHMPETCNGSVNVWSRSWKMLRCNWKQPSGAGVGSAGTTN